MRHALCSAICAASLATAMAAHAADRKDGSHGRVDGDLAVEAGVGASLGPRSPRGAADVRLRYLSMAGVFVTYEDGPIFGSRAEPMRALATGVELRPLFFAKWFTGRYSGNPYLDLAIDSIGLELGAVFLQPNGAKFGSKPGLQAGLAFEVPVFPSATGPFIAVHGGVRWSDAALSGGPSLGPADRALYVNVIFAWQQIFGAHVVDMGDRAP
jgi:hypothetical protein